MRFTIFLAFLLFSISSYAQTQTGIDIDGEAAYDLSGQTSMPDANTVAIGAVVNAGNGVYSGHVRIYSWNGSAWTQKGVDIDGEAAGDRSGQSVSMPDANTVAIGAPGNGGNGYGAGHVRIYTWNGSAWTQKGIDIDGEAANDRSGQSVSMPDANTVAIGAMELGNVGYAGYVRIYTWNGSAWTQKGVDIDGEAAGDGSGHSVSMPDANTVAIGAPRNDGNGLSAGHVRVYTWNGSAWTQKGVDIDGEAAGDDLGNSVSMPDANTLAIGAQGNGGNGNGSGHVRIYTWNGSAWTQKGVDIDGEAVGDRSGWSVSMPDTNTLAIAAPLNDGYGTDAGHVRIYTWNGSAWAQTGVDIDGEAAGDQSGYSVSMPDANTMAIGAIRNDGNGTDAGHVRVYSLCPPTSGTDVQTSCDSYTWPANLQTYTTTGTYTTTLTNAAGCDSVVTLNLTIDSSNTGSQTEVACDAFTWAANSQTYTTTGTYVDTLTNAAGCDSVVNLNLTVIYSTSSSQTEVVCDSFMWATNSQTYTTSGTYLDTLTNAAGCDSVVTLNLTVNYSNTGSQTEIACDSFIWAANNQTYFTSGSYVDTLTNAAGCDSVVTLDLTVNYSNSGSQTEVACEEFTWSANSKTYTNSGTYVDTLTNAAGCDSVVTLNLTINYSDASTQTETACFSYLWDVNDSLYSIGGTYNATIPTSKGCDSVITLTLTINNVDTAISVDGITLTAAAGDATYQWLDCSLDYTPIAGATNQSYTATENGSYAVEVTQTNCVDTSRCVEITTVGISSTGNDFAPNIYPNPTRSDIMVDFTQTISSGSIVMLDAFGKRVLVQNFKDTERVILNTNQLASGIYLIQINANDYGFGSYRVVKQ